MDIYTYGSAMGLSAETPTIVARKKEVKYSLGGAALVCRNLLELGAKVRFITLAGGDDEASYVSGFSAPGLILKIVIDRDRPTTVKHRFWVDGYKLFQLDQRDDRAISAATAKQVQQQVSEALSETDIVVISDYRHGLIAPELLAELLPCLHKSKKPVFVDSQVSQIASNHTSYSGGCIICLNLKEARCIDPAFTPELDPRAFFKLSDALDTEQIVIKLGSEGAMLRDGANVIHIPAIKVRVEDTTGAGDAFLAALSLAGLQDPAAALTLANAWAGLSVQIHGTTPPKKSDLFETIEEL